MKKFCIILSLLIMFCLISCTTTPEDKKNEIIHTVTFDSNGGSLVETQYVKDLEYAVKPANPTKEGYLELLYSNPCGFRLTSRMTTNYQQLKTIYSQRKTHRLPEWRAFCKWIETLPYAKEFIIGG